MELKRNGSQPSGKGPAEHFTGSVRFDCLFDPMEPGRVGALSVTFEPCARIACHSHPLDRHLVVTAGCGLVQNWEGPVETIRPGDVVWSPPGEKHWYGATPTTSMTHISIVERHEGKSAEWMEHVSDEEFQAGAKAE